MAKLLAIAGSPSHPSKTYALVEHASQLLQKEGFQVDLISVRDLPAEDLVFGRYDSPALVQSQTLVAEATGIIIATPIYKAAYTGVLKAFLDLLPQKALLGKVILPIATGGTLAHLLAIDYALKPVLSELGARYLLGGIYAVDKQLQRQEDGSIQPDEDIAERLRHSLRNFVGVIHQLPAETTDRELIHSA